MISTSAFVHLLLQHTPAIPPAQRKKILNQFGSSAKLLDEGINMTRDKLVNQFDILPTWKEELEICQREGIHLISQEDDSYPDSFRLLTSVPELLRIKGNLDLQKNFPIAVVGTRNASVYGKEQAYSFAKEMAQTGVSILSGLARGIDTAAHLGALEKGITIAFLGSGLKSLYPKENEKLSEKICHQGGALVSEYPLFTPPARYTFPERNRLIAAASRALLMIESPLQGGSIITMEMGEKLNKPLFTIPARLEMTTFKGNFLLLKQKRATLVESGQDLLKMLDFIVQKSDKKKMPKKKMPRVDGMDLRVYKALLEGEKSFDELVWLTQLPTMELNVLLTRLQLMGQIKELQSKVYQWVNH